MTATQSTEPSARNDESSAWVDAVAPFVVAMIVVGVAVWLGARGPIVSPETHDLSAYPGSGLFGGWFRFDGRWYDIISTQGYSFNGSDAQSPVAFFPAYPLVLWVVHAVTGMSVKLLGTLVTMACGLAVVVLFHRWARGRVDAATARVAVITLVVYPYAYYLMGAVYADALFLLAAIGAFVLLERDHPVLAGLAGLVATATRPVGIAVVVGLVAVTLWRRAVVERRGRGLTVHWNRLHPGDAGVLLSVGGLVGWMTYLWVRFGHPFAFEEVQKAPGWDQGAGPRTWFKITWLQQLHRLPGTTREWLAHGDPVVHEKMLYGYGVLLQGALVGVFLVLAWLAWRRLGWGYGVYSFALLAIPLVGTKDFQGSGRYLLAAFPCFVAAATVLVERRALRWGCWSASATVLLGWTFAFGRGYYVS